MAESEVTHCPCGGRLMVLDTRAYPEYVRRRRKCDRCDLRVKTYEVIGRGRLGRRRDLFSRRLRVNGRVYVEVPGGTHLRLVSPCAVYVAPDTPLSDD